LNGVAFLPPNGDPEDGFLPPPFDIDGGFGGIPGVNSGIA
jgi:hypothetical protein